MSLTPELMARIRDLSLRAGFVATDALAGEYTSAFRGLGQEFDEVREYLMGDDVRAIDWNVTARMNEPYVKVYREEREMTLMLVVDVSASQRFGSTGRFRQEASAELAAILALLATKNNDRVGLVIFSDHVEEVIPPAKGRAHVWRIVRSVLSHEPTGKRTDLDLALKSCAQLLKRRSMCFVVSDFIDVGGLSALKRLAKRHDLICVRTEDPRERELEPVGVVGFVDPESGEEYFVDTSNEAVRQSYQQGAERELAAFRDEMRQAGAGVFSIETDASVVDALARHLRQRERRRGR